MISSPPLCPLRNTNICACEKKKHRSIKVAAAPQAGWKGRQAGRLGSVPMLANRCLHGLHQLRYMAVSGLWWPPHRAWIQSHSYAAFASAVLNTESLLLNQVRERVAALVRQGTLDRMLRTAQVRLVSENLASVLTCAVQLYRTGSRDELRYEAQRSSPSQLPAPARSSKRSKRKGSLELDRYLARRHALKKMDADMLVRGQVFNKVTDIWQRVIDESAALNCCSVLVLDLQSPDGIVIRLSEVYTPSGKKPLLKSLGYLDIQGSVHVSEMADETVDVSGLDRALCCAVLGVC